MATSSNEETMTSTHSGWRGRRWCWSVQQTTRQRVPQCTIAGNRAEQSPTKGAVCRPSRHRLSDEVFPATHESGNTRGKAEFTTMPRVKRQFKATELWRQRPLHAQRAEGREGSEHVKKRAEENTWVSTWTGEQLVETTQALDEPRHHTAKTVRVRRS